MFHCILVATDFSPCAERALSLAIDWAAREGAALEVVHAFDRPVRAVPGGSPWLSSDAEAAHAGELALALERDVARARARVASATGVLLRGRPHEAILERALESRADLVVVGDRGLGALSRALLGSVADRLLRTAPTSLLIVPEATSVSTAPRVIVVPTDFSEPAKRAADRAMILARELGARVEIVHAWEMPSSATHSEGVAEDVRSAVLRTVRATHPAAPGVEVRHHAREGAPLDVIAALVGEVRADLVVMPPTGHGRARWLGSVTDRVVRSSHAPVLVVRDAPSSRA